MCVPVTVTFKAVLPIISLSPPRSCSLLEVKEKGELGRRELHAGYVRMRVVYMGSVLERFVLKGLF